MTAAEALALACSGDNRDIDTSDIQQAVIALANYVASGDPLARHAAGGVAYLAAYLGLDFSV